MILMFLCFFMADRLDSIITFLKRYDVCFFFIGIFYSLPNFFGTPTNHDNSMVFCFFLPSQIVSEQV